MKSKLTILCAALMVLSGCTTTMKNKFDCPGAPGVRCKSISEVNELVDRSIVSQDNFLRWSDRTGRTRIVNPSSKDIFSVWVAPYEDSKGIYHHSTVLTSELRSEQLEIV